MILHPYVNQLTIFMQAYYWNILFHRKQLDIKDFFSKF